MIDYDKLKREPLYQIAVNRLGYKPVIEKDSQLWKCLESPEGYKIITKVIPNANGHFLFFSSSHDISGTIIDLLIKVHEFSVHDIQHFFKGEIYEISKPAIEPTINHKTWLTDRQVRQMYLQGYSSIPNMLLRRGLTLKTLRRFRIRASEYQVIFPLYRLEKGDWVASSAIQYKRNRKKYFKGPRTLSFLSPLTRKQLKNPAIYFFESPIDALAYAQIQSVKDESLLVSFCGLPTRDFYTNLKLFLAYFKPRSYQVCFDNDEAGNKAAQKLLSCLPYDKTKIILPPKACKDWALCLSNVL